MSRTLILGLVVFALLAAAVYLLGREGEAPIQTSVSVAEALGGVDTAGYARADHVRRFSFPEDHGPHPAYKTEWWYFTGNLETEGGRHVGYQFTLFRVALAPPDTAPVRPAAARAPAARAPDTAGTWRADQFYMAHFSVSDIQAEQMHDFERFSRGAAGLAGARADTAAGLRLWLEDWTVHSTESGNAGARAFPLRIQAAAEGEAGEHVAVDLAIRPAKPRVLQGERGLSQKGPGAGNASYYYSYTRLRTTGTVALGSDTLHVRGWSWMDREWSTSALGPDQEGWVWFALQMDNGRELMYYQIRAEGGRPSRFSEGVLVGPEGGKTTLARADVRLDVLEQWTSPRGGTYPARWRVHVPSEDIDLTVTPYFADQELDASVRYWEGAVRVRGTWGGARARGSGYVELTGYGDGPSRPGG